MASSVPGAAVVLSTEFAYDEDEDEEQGHDGDDYDDTEPRLCRSVGTVGPWV